MKFGLSSGALKYIAIFCMTLDHLAMYFFASQQTIWLYIAMRFIGKIALPIFCFLIAEGFYHTRNRSKYAARIALFAVVSYLPYAVFNSKFTSDGNIEYLCINVMFSLLCGLLALSLYKRPMNNALKFFGMAFLCLVTFKADWSLFAVIFILVFGIIRENKTRQMQAYTFAVLFYLLYKTLINVDGFSLSLATEFVYYNFIPRIGLFAAIPIILMYNGKAGNLAKNHPWTKWIFYFYYPSHLLLIRLLAYMRGYVDGFINF